MGNSQSTEVEEQGHPDVYYKGAAAVKEGRYQVAETYFQQAMRKHPGRQFWCDLTGAVWSDKKIDTSSGHSGPFSSRSGSEAAHSDVDSEAVFDEAGSSINPLDTDSSKTKTVKKEGNNKSKAATRIKKIPFPLDQRLEGIMDYTRMICDMSNCYLRRPQDEVNRQIAYVYNGFLNSHFQLFFYALKIWMTENAEALAAMYAAAAGAAPKEDENAKGVAGSNNTSGTDSDSMIALKKDKNNSKREKSSSSVDYAGPAECLYVVELVYAFLRYYWIQTVFNSMVLGLLYIQERVDPTDVRKISQIRANIVELGASAQYDLTYISSLHVQNACGKTLQENMPEAQYEFRVEEIVETNEKDANNKDKRSQGQSSDKRTVVDSFFASVINERIGHLTFLTISNMFTPTRSFTLDLNVDLPVRLDVQYQVPRKDVANLEHPCHRQSLYYMNWFLIQDVFILPGHNSHYLNNYIPNYTNVLNAYYEKLAKGKVDGASRVSDAQKNNKTSLQLIAKETQASGGVSLVKNNGDKDAQQTISAFEDKGTKAQKKVNLDALLRRKELHPYANPLLDIKDLNITRLMVFEEAFLLEVPVMLLMSKLYEKTSNHEKANKYASLVKKSSEAFYGVDSEETKFFVSMFDLYEL